VAVVLCRYPRAVQQRTFAKNAIAFANIDVRRQSFAASIAAKTRWLWLLLLRLLLCCLRALLRLLLWTTT
jgi:hypothetical protein